MVDFVLPISPVPVIMLCSYWSVLTVVIIKANFPKVKLDFIISQLTTVTMLMLHIFFQCSRWWWFCCMSVCY